ncbi:MAG: hypothetical protein KJ773_00330 [Candidatus Thermoplasmatota archaeon]|nr:hypothetical protein [Candidatus Thermoplasmatota archaeon]
MQEGQNQTLEHLSIQRYRPGAPGETKGGENISKGGKGCGRSQSANDQRSNSMNQNNAAYQASADNHSNQLNPNHPEYVGDEDEEEE